MASSTSLPIVLGDTSVSFNGTAAPLYYVSSTQVNAQVPFDLAVGTINVQVRRGSMISATMTVHVGAFSPGIFTDQAGTGAILHAGNFSVVSAGAPARVGEFILIFATGLGSLRTPFPSGMPAPSNPPADTLITPIVTIGGLSATVGFSGLAPGFVGLYQLNVQVPASLASGNQPVQILAGGHGGRDALDGQRMTEAIFWSAFVCIVYVYGGYPLLLAVWRWLAPRPVRKQYHEPTVSLVIAMFNESRNVAQKMRNCFELDYPSAKLQIIVSLDAPTDGTDALMRSYERVDVVSSAIRIGKAASLNNGVAKATGDIVLFADSRQHFEKNVVREIVANFADESVGAVSGELILLDQDGQEASDGAGAYWRYEKKIRRMESAIHSVPGAT
jgi:uncharacterized protein (TIGR03437 family)